MLFLLYSLQSMITVAGDPPSLHFSFGLFREFINISIIFGLLYDNESWKLALLGLVVLQTVISGAVLVHAGAVLALVLVVSFAAGTIGLIMFYESRRLIMLWTLLMAAWPVYLLSVYLRLLS